jgi:signal transduction histidine kinase
MSQSVDNNCMFSYYYGVLSRKKKWSEEKGIRRIRRFIFLYRAIFFILGLAAISMTGVLFLFNISNNTNIKFITNTAINDTEKAFKDIEKSSVNMLSAALESAMYNDKISKCFLLRDRSELLKVTKPLFDHLKEQNGITHWYFIEADSKKTCFLRVHTPHLHSDRITRSTLDRCILTKEFVWGKELGKTAVAVRAVHPYYHEDQLIGYMEMAVSINHFLRRLKERTSGEYGLLVDKAYLDHRKWVSVTKVRGERNNWDDQERFLLIDKTSESIAKGLPPKAETNLVNIPNRGVLLEKLSKGNKHYVRGVFPFYDANERKIGGVFILRNITPTYNAMQEQKTRMVWLLILFMGLVTFFMIFFHKRAETELRNYRGRLEEMVDEATAEIRETNRKLNLEIEDHKTLQQALEEECEAREVAEKKQIKAIKQAERTARLASIGVMAAGITHEINQPLNAIKVSADSIQFWHKRNPGNLPETFTDQLHVLSRSVNRIVEIIQHMRAFWVVPDTPVLEMVDLGKAVKNALSLTRLQLHAHGIQEHLELDMRALMVEGNLIHLEQIIINLVVNAIHALDEKEQRNKELKISTWDDEARQFAYLSIEDNGPGLPDGGAEKIFDPFFSTHNGGEGMGLGLAIVKRYVDRYNGSIEAVNNHDNEKVLGARFTLKFPIFEVIAVENRTIGQK